MENETNATNLNQEEIKDEKNDLNKVLEELSSKIDSKFSEFGERLKNLEEKNEISEEDEFSDDDLFESIMGEEEKKPEAKEKPAEKPAEEKKEVKKEVKIDEKLEKEIDEKDEEFNLRDEFEMRLAEHELRDELMLARQQYPNITEIEILREIEDNPDKSAIEIAKELSAKKEEEEKALKNKFREEFRKEFEEELKGKVSIPQTPSGGFKQTPRDEAEDFLAYSDERAWASAVEKAKAELKEGKE